MLTRDALLEITRAKLILNWVLLTIFSTFKRLTRNDVSSHDGRPNE